jgi:ankyrin repeat protein
MGHLSKYAKEGNLQGVIDALMNGADVNEHHLEMCGYPLRAATMYDHLDIAKVLLKNGADIHVLSDMPLKNAVSQNNSKMVELLLKNGADVHADDDWAFNRAKDGHYHEVLQVLETYVRMEKLSRI